MINKLIGESTYEVTYKIGKEQYKDSAFRDYYKRGL